MAYFQAAQGPAILFLDDHFLGHIHKFPCEVTRVGCLQGGIRQSLTGPVCGDEILEDIKPFTEVRRNRLLDDLTHASRECLLGFGHEASHSGQLCDLGPGSPGSGIHHHEDRVEPAFVILHLCDHLISHLLRCMGPGVDDHVVTLCLGDDPLPVLVPVLIHLFSGLVDHLFFDLRGQQVVRREGGP